MKTFKNIFLITLFLISIPFVSCNKNNDNVPSKITFLPDLKIIGDDLVIIELGNDYEELGAEAYINGVEAEYKTVSNVNDAQAGLYTVTYSVANEDNFSVSKLRTVIVFNPEVINDDLSGTYERDNPISPGRSVWTKDAEQPYKYLVNNPGGVINNPLFDAPFDVYNVDYGVVCVPIQQSGGLSPFYCTDPNGNRNIPFNNNANVGTVAYEWIVVGANFGSSIRAFKKI